MAARIAQGMATVETLYSQPQAVSETEQRRNTMKADRGRSLLGGRRRNTSRHHSMLSSRRYEEITHPSILGREAMMLARELIIHSCVSSHNFYNHSALAMITYLAHQINKAAVAVVF